MAITVKAHTRRSKKGVVQVRSYNQSRRTAKKVKKSHTECQKMIARVIKLKNRYNATKEQLRTDPLWRNYVCNCPESSHYKWITGQDGLSEEGQGVQAKLTDYTSPTNKRVYKASIVNVPAKTVKSRCGVSIFIPAHRRTLQGKSLAFLLATKA